MRGSGKLRKDSSCVFALESPRPADGVSMKVLVIALFLGSAMLVGTGTGKYMVIG